MNGILSVEKKNVLFEHDSLQFVTPDRQPVFEAKLGYEMPVLVRLFRAAGLFSTDMDQTSIRHSDMFGQMIEHDGAAERSRQRGDKQTVIAPRNAAGDRAGGI